MHDEIDLSDAILLFSDNRGRYIPQAFANFIDRSYVTGVDDADWDTLEAGPDGEAYWDAWDEVLNNAVLTFHGMRYCLWQDGDLWATPIEA